ncbi:VanZ family protein [Fictibacillus aquaticus]|uniref:VanZ-like domain-containing protein n=1 Tax=Fictibacillus aquaticus TaxID=2021314 RepID=A0A235F920_9BACL|nr:VanZ family protein [Fictibacillus aquaticus]OYD57584.1 hypothetical protein CGZ90_13025 [Fictibacillus aquaticus]
MAKKVINWLLVLLWMGVIFFASSQPYEKQNMKPLWQEHLPVEEIEKHADFVSFPYAGEEVSMKEDGAANVIEFFVRKAAHVGTYFILAVLLYRAIGRASLAWIFTVLYAMSDEFHQSITPNRTPHWEDVVLDAFGALLGVLVCVLLARRKKKRRY